MLTTGQIFSSKTTLGLSDLSERFHMAGEEDDDVQPDSPPGFVNEIDSNELKVIEVRSIIKRPVICILYASCYSLEYVLIVTFKSVNLTDFLFVCSVFLCHFY